MIANPIMIYSRLLALSALILLLLGCQPATDNTQPPQPTASVALTPYITTTQVETTRPASATLISSSPTPAPSPTSTPVTYSIIEGDTLLSIAYRYDVSLDEILAVNPGLDPNFLTIGTMIILPGGAQDSPVLPEPTPIPLQLSTPVCLKDASQGAWCYTWIKNPTGAPVENVSARITISSEYEDNPLAEIALPPIDLLSPESELPAFCYFPFLPSLYEIEANLNSALPGNSDQSRFVEHVTEIEALQFSPDRQSARVTVAITVIADQLNASSLKLAVIALNQKGEIVGFKQAELFDDYQTGQVFLFDLSIYSLSGEISTVQVLTELKP